MLETDRGLRCAFCKFENMEGASKCLECSRHLVARSGALHLAFVSRPSAKPARNRVSRGKPPAPRAQTPKASRRTMANTRAWLQIGSLPPIPLRTGELTMGRDTSCDVVLPHSGVSRFHAVIRVSEDGSVQLTDESRNGTRLNGQKLRLVTELGPSSVVKIGPYKAQVFRLDLPSPMALHWPR